MRIRLFPGRILPPLPLIIPSILSGALTTLCFPTVNLGPVSMLALAPVFVATLRFKPGRRDAFRAGFLMGATLFVGMLWWIVKLIPSADVTIPWLMTPALIILVLYLALYPAFLMLVLAALTRWRLPAFIVSAPALWALFEVARSRGELAFPWGLLGYTLSDNPSLLQTADIWGVYGLSYLVVLVNALVAGVVVAKGPHGRALCGLLACAITGGMHLYGEARMERVRAVAGDSLRVAIAQPNIDLAIKWKPEFRDSSFAQIDRQTLIAARQNAELVIFPETCAPMYIENSPGRRSRIQGMAKSLDLPIFMGFLDHRYDGPGASLNIFNSSGVFRTDGTLQKYDKRHLLPFGEALPLASRLRWLRKIEFGQANFEPGPRRPPLDAGPVRFTPLICFESVFPELCRDGVREGSELFVNITNDGWFGDTPGPYQHAQMAIARSVEFRRFLVRSANSGVSMVVTPAGEVRETIGLYQTEVLTTGVLRMGGETFYARFGDAPFVAVCVLLVLVTVLARRRGGATPPEL